MFSRTRHPDGEWERENHLLHGKRSASTGERRRHQESPPVKSKRRQRADEPEVNMERGRPQGGLGANRFEQPHRDAHFRPRRPHAKIAQQAPQEKTRRKLQREWNQHDQAERKTRARLRDEQYLDDLGGTNDAGIAPDLLQKPTVAAGLDRS